MNDGPRDLQPHPANQLLSFSMQFNQPWETIRPRVFRYMPAVYVDRFFDDGSLRLSSFKRFAQHSDEQRRDTAEGKGVRTGQGKGLTVVMATSRGSDCYVLCGSVVYSAEMQQAFLDADACFAIDDTLNFSAAIARSIAGFKGGMEGLTIYQDDTVIRRDLGDITSEGLLDQYKQEDGSISMEMLPHLQAMIGGREEFFLKHMRYSHQAEYRMLWSVDGEAQDFIDLKVPMACQFCRRIS